MNLAFANSVFKGSGVGLRSRKNLGKARSLLGELMEAKVLKQGDVITTQQLEKVIRKENLHTLWNETENAGDPYGLRRALGDLIGGHGLNLRKRGKGYEIPAVLPEVDGDTVMVEAVYS